ncbi:MAG: AarF/ABC1/UbiB kinase family protein [Candidatus Pelagadaptatus aseana]|uniref:ABC1 kinase family protein n=1 Tax=Candidatus Pelagadaptatus aseana TaxID=3120508 RepID=UPI0039B16FBA
MKKSKSHIKRLKTGKLERRLSLAGVGVKTGARATTQLWGGLLKSKDKRQAHRREVLANNASQLADDLGKLKGGVVKVGQVMALYGDYVLPDEVALAFRKLEEQTHPVHWDVIEEVLAEELDDAHRQKLQIDTHPLGAASLSQVHKATLDGVPLCLKVQYPGVADAIDTDLDAVTQMLKVARLIKMGDEFEDWLGEVRRVLHQEVDYELEASAMRRFAERLKGDPMLRVPRVYEDWSSPRVLVQSFESGYAFNSPEVQALSQARRNRLAEAFLHLFFKEVFDWHEMQTDPNFGNYRVQIDPEGEDDKLVLLDFGAVCSYPEAFFEPLKTMIRGAFQKDREQVIAGILGMSLLRRDSSRNAQERFSTLLLQIIEPLNYHPDDLPEGALNEQGDYRWAHSGLPKRAAKVGAKQAMTTDFEMPPKEFAFISRKLLGVYNVMTTLDAELSPPQWLADYLH